MGWLWSSSPTASSNNLELFEKANSSSGRPTPKRDFSLSDEQRARIFGGLGTPRDDSKQRSRDVNEDVEVEAFLRELAAVEPKGSTHAEVEPSSERAQDAAPLPTNHDRYLPDGSLNIHPDALYPATMNCRQLFDQAFYCQSLGGKFNDIYRFGHLNNCSEQWGAFWYCMGIRTLPGKDKEAQVRDYYRQRDERRRKEGKGNSEDVWDLRTSAVKEAFQKSSYDGERKVKVKE